MISVFSCSPLNFKYSFFLAWYTGRPACVPFKQTHWQDCKIYCLRCWHFFSLLLLLLLLFKHLMKGCIVLISRGSNQSNHLKINNLKSSKMSDTNKVYSPTLKEAIWCLSSVSLLKTLCVAHPSLFPLGPGRMCFLSLTERMLSPASGYCP